MDLRRDALQIFRAALAASDAGNAVRRHFTRSASRVHAGEYEFDLKSCERVLLVAVGKAAVPMASAVREVLGDLVRDSLVITKHGHRGAFDFPCWETGHPVPDEAGFQAALAVREFVSHCTERDLVMAAISGGASALLPAAAPPLKLQSKQDATELLLKAGADIGELNAVRKHLSFLKGGRLAALAAPATVIGLLLSDVIGDRLDVIGSGLTAPDPTSFRDALAVLDRYELRERVDRSVLNHLLNGSASRIDETPKPGDPIFERVHNVVVGSNRLALAAAAQEAQALGYRPRILSSDLQGEARMQAKDMVAELGGELGPACVLAGGETTVTVRGAGKGGRNQEFALAAAIELRGIPNLALLSAGTDGTDGPTDAAGAIALGDTVDRAAALGMSAETYLSENDSYPFFDRLDDLVRTGPTGTNVMDVCVLLTA
jgi:hydroxypyruvate reductase